MFLWQLKLEESSSAQATLLLIAQVLPETTNVLSNPELQLCEQLYSSLSIVHLLQSQQKQSTECKRSALDAYCSALSHIIRHPKDSYAMEAEKASSSICSMCLELMQGELTVRFLVTVGWQPVFSYWFHGSFCRSLQPSPAWNCSKWSVSGMIQDLYQ